MCHTVSVAVIAGWELAVGLSDAGVVGVDSTRRTLREDGIEAKVATKVFVLIDERVGRTDSINRLRGGVGVNQCVALRTRELLERIGRSDLEEIVVVFRGVEHVRKQTDDAVVLGCLHWDVGEGFVTTAGESRGVTTHCG